MKKVIGLLLQYKKWIFVMVYLVAILLVWYQRDTAYRHIPLLFRETLFGDLFLDMIFFSLALVGFVCHVQLLRSPVFLKRRFTLGVKRAGLRNALGEYPVLISVRKDKNKCHGIILNVKNVGISVPDFDREVERLQTGLKGKIYRMEYDQKVTHTLLYYLPQKYVRSTYIFPTDESIGRIAFQQLINLLVIGPTGTGKTVAIKILMAKIAKYQPDAKIWLLDFKRFDFREFSDLPRYYGYTDCVQGLNDYYGTFKKQQEMGAADGPNYLIVDEWGSFVMSLEKKEAEKLKGKLAELLMLGRAYQFYPIIGIQRPDSAYFASSRDNFQSCLALGNLSPEGRRMVFPDSAAGQIVECHKREGHLYIDGVGLEKVKIADIPDIAALDATIREAMYR